MPASLSLDLIEGSVVDNGTDFARVVRAGIVKDIDVNAVGFDPMALIKALGTAGMPQLNELHPSGTPGLRVVRHVVRGLANDQARVEVVYETPQFGGGTPQPPTGAFLIKDSTTLVSEKVQLGPGAQPLVVTMGGGLLGPGPFDLAKQATLDRLTPLRNLVLFGTMITTNPQQIQNGRTGVGYVNDRTWSGRPKGYWLCTKFDSETLDLGVTYQVTAQFTSRQYRDWKSYYFWRNAVGELEQATIDAAPQIQQMMADEYSFSMKNQGYGFMTVGLYDLADFGAIYGNF